MLRKHVKCCRLVKSMGVGLYRIRMGDSAQRMLTLPLGRESLTLPLFLRGIFKGRMHHISMNTVYILLYMHIIRLNANAWPMAQAQIFGYGIMKNSVAVCKQI